MKVVIDTNVLLTSIPKISKYRPIFDGLFKAKYRLAISTAILDEYLEIIGEKTNSKIANNLGELLVQLPNVEKTEIYFRWNLISIDPDDNKFVDCAISARAQLIVTNDKHFKVLKAVDFPVVELMDADEFLERVLAM